MATDQAVSTCEKRHIILCTGWWAPRVHLDERQRDALDERAAVADQQLVPHLLPPLQRHRTAADSAQQRCRRSTGTNAKLQMSSGAHIKYSSATVRPQAARKNLAV